MIDKTARATVICESKIIIIIPLNSQICKSYTWIFFGVYDGSERKFSGTITHRKHKRRNSLAGDSRGTVRPTLYKIWDAGRPAFASFVAFSSFCVCSVVSSKPVSKIITNKYSNYECSVWLTVEKMQLIVGMKVPVILLGSVDMQFFTYIVWY